MRAEAKGRRVPCSTSAGNMLAGDSDTALCMPMPGNDHDCESTMSIDLEGTSTFSE